MDETLLGYLLAALVVTLGVLVYWQLKWASRKKRTRDTFEYFFLGGGSVGQLLTTNNNWGLCFAFANAVWYFAFLGYYYGPWSFLLQLPWTISVICIAYLLRRYITASTDGTVHGFIAHNYGLKAATIAAIATIIGYTLNCGFELFYSAHLFAVTFSAVQIELVVAIAFAGFVGAYCMAGGYTASVVTDRWQNRIGVIALILLIALLTPQFESANGSWLPFQTAHKFDTPPWYFLVGVSTFAFFFNFVDMANWQSLAANRNLPPEGLKSVSRGLIKSALLQVFAPGLLGAWLGVMIKVLQPTSTDDKYFQSAFGIAFPHMNALNGVLLGIILLGFVSVTISSAGSYLVAAMQTLAVDLFKRRQMRTYLDPTTPSEQKIAIEDQVLSWVKRNVLVVSLFMTLSFAALYYGLDQIHLQPAVFQFQFAMYGAAVTLIPAVMSKLLKKQPSLDSHTRGGFSSIFVGLIFVLVPFIVASFFWTVPAVQTAIHWLRIPSWVNPDVIDNLSPALGLIASTLTFFLLRGKAK